MRANTNPSRSHCWSVKFSGWKLATSYLCSDTFSWLADQNCPWHLTCIPDRSILSFFRPSVRPSAKNKWPVGRSSWLVFCCKMFGAKLQQVRTNVIITLRWDSCVQQTGYCVVSVRESGLFPRYICISCLGYKGSHGRPELLLRHGCEPSRLKRYCCLSDNDIDIDNDIGINCLNHMINYSFFFV